MRRLSRALVAGAAGTAAMTASTAAEMRLRGRPASTAPIRAAERATGITLPSDRVRRALSWGAHVPFGVATGALRAVLPAPAFALAAWLPDLVVVPALDDDTPPPWRWGAGELALSALHHAVYAAAAEVAWRSAS